MKSRSSLIYASVGLLSFLVLFSIPLNVRAATSYVLSGAGGNGSGTDWTNAYTSLPATLTRGDTYYIGDGGYGSYTFDDATSGSTYIYIKKATASAHGTGTGWSDSYGDGVATFSGVGFTTSYYDFNGITGGGIGSWNTGHGFEITRTGASCGDNGNLITFGAGVSNVSVSHTHMYGGNNNYPLTGVKGTSGNSNLNFSYDSIHTIFGPAFHIGTWSASTIEQSYMADVRSTGSVDAYCPDWHAEGVSSIGTNIDLTFRNNLWDRIGGTAVFAGVNTGSSADWKIYGNVFTRSGSPIYYYYEADPSTNKQIMTGLQFYNNTIANNIGNSQGGVAIQSGSNNAVYNNIWYNNDANSFGISATHDRNFFSENIRSADCTPACDKNADAATGEIAAQISSGSPFVSNNSNPLLADFRLAAATNGGSTFSSPFNVDAYGITRGGDGTWDRGAYEYVPAVVVVTPTVTTGLASSLTTTSVILAGSITVTGGANATTRGFQYGLTTAYGSNTTESGSFVIASFTGLVSSLQCNTVYHYRSYASNSAGTAYGSDGTFTTSACAVVSGGGGSSGGGSSSGGGVASSGGGGGGGATIVPAISGSVSGATKNPISSVIPVAKAGIILTKNLYVGITDPEVLVLQTYLVSQGLLAATPTGYYGSLTSAAVKKYQSAHGISPVGTVGPVTRASLAGSAVVSITTTQPVTTFTRLLTIGSTGADVTALQKFLIAKKYLTGSPSGYYDSLTLAAVGTFQTSQGIVKLGEGGYGNVGPKTRAALNTLGVK